MTFGNYVLFNLLVAILVEGFSSEVSAPNRFMYVTALYGYKYIEFWKYINTWFIFLALRYVQRKPYLYKFT